MRTLHFDRGEEVSRSSLKISDMLIFPTPEQRKRILGNIVDPEKSGDSRPAHCRAADERACAESIHCEKKRRREDSFRDGHFKLSPFAFLFGDSGYTALYHSLNQAIVYGDSRLEQFFRFLKERDAASGQSLSELMGDFADLRRLCGEGFLLRAADDPHARLKCLQKQKYYNTPHISLMYLLVTNDCNLRCGYCTIESLSRKPRGFRCSHMPLELAEKGVDLFFDVLQPGTRKPRIIYYGGEPLLNVQTLIGSARYVRKKIKEKNLEGFEPEFSAVLNGTLITEDIARELHELGVGAAVSLDGLKHHHDRMRKYRTRKGSWEDSLRGYYLLKKYFGSGGISCTIGSHNYRDLEEIAEFFAHTLECRGLGFNILKGHPPDNRLEISPEECTSKLLSAFEIFRRYGIYEDRVMRKVRSFANRTEWFYDCGGYGGQIVLCADGSMGPCHIAADDRRFLWGSIGDGDIGTKIMESDMTAQWLHRSPLFYEECQACEALAICGGGCADEACVKKGDMHAMDDNFCVHAKLILKWLIKDLAAKLKLSPQGALIP